MDPPKNTDDVPNATVSKSVGPSSLRILQLASTASRPKIALLDWHNSEGLRGGGDDVKGYSSQRRNPIFLDSFEVFGVIF